MIGWGIIGIGKHADTRMVPALRRTANNRLVAVCSRDLGRAQAFAQRHGAQAGYDSYGQLLARPDVDVVYVATPHHLHREHLIAAARAGKHVLCEKPLGLTVAEAEEMVAICRDAGVLLGVCFHNRYHPAHVEARRLATHGELGPISLVRVQYSSNRSGEWEGWRADPSMSGAGCLMGLGLHALDLVRFVTGEEVVEVTAMMDVPPGSGSVDYAVAVLLRLSGGGFALVNSSRRMPWANNDVIVNGSLARVSTLGTTATLLQGSLELASDSLSQRTEYRDPDPATGLYADMVQDFGDSVASGRQPRARGEDGLAMARIAEAVLRSAAAGRTVRL